MVTFTELFDLFFTFNPLATVGIVVCVTVMAVLTVARVVITIILLMRERKQPPPELPEICKPIRLNLHSRDFSLRE